MTKNYVLERDLHQDKQRSACTSVPRDTRIKEASVKKLKYFSLAVLVLSLLAIPETAQKGKDRDNKGAASTGDARADLVKSTNKTPSKCKDNDKNDTKGKRKGFTQGKHKGRH